MRPGGDWFGGKYKWGGLGNQMATDNTQTIGEVLRLIDREVWIITAAHGKDRGGLVATWVSPASIDPQQPAMLVGIAPNHHTAELIDGSEAFAAHLLTADEIDLVWRFGLASGRDLDKLAGLEFTSSASGTPILGCCLAWLDCRVVARYDAGDRLYYWADVEAAGRLKAGAPLRESQVVAAATAEQAQAMRQGRLKDVAILEPLRARWIEQQRRKGGQ